MIKYIEAGGSDALCTALNACEHECSCDGTKMTVISVCAIPSKMVAWVSIEPVPVIPVAPVQEPKIEAPKPAEVSAHKPHHQKPNRR